MAGSLMMRVSTAEVRSSEKERFEESGDLLEDITNSLSND